MKVKRDTLLLQRARELEAALEARGYRDEAAGI
jgi:energy-coupling factor transporter transmembrane protein EcfT